MSLPKEKLQGAERVWDYHRQSKLTAANPMLPADMKTRGETGHDFDFAPKIDLSRSLLDLPTATFDVIERGLDALPESLHEPPQTLSTLSTWLYMAAGQRPAHRFEWGTAPLRASPSADATHPGEIYVAVFSIEGLKSGLYHFSPSEFSLRHLRDGPETLLLLRRGRPDLNFLAAVPAALLVSSVFRRSTWRQERRGYRQAVIDVGQLVTNCHVAATGLGMATHVRLRMADACTRELIGLSEDYDFACAEAVQAMVVWADGSDRPMSIVPEVSQHPLPPIPRLCGSEVVTYGSVTAVHREMIARGIATREIRPPLTDLTPLPANVPMTPLLLARGATPSKSVRSVLTDTKQVDAFEKRPLPRDMFCHIARGAFRGGTYFPIKPEGPHVGLVRPFWILHEVPGQDEGVWWHDPHSDRWALLNRGSYKFECGDLTRGREIFEHAAAVCVMVANLQRLLLDAGPDAYRLAFLEAGVAAQRMNLAAISCGFACRSFGDFYDDAWKQFLGLGTTGWEPLLVCAIGTAKRPAANGAAGSKGSEEVGDISCLRLID